MKLDGLSKKFFIYDNNSVIYYYYLKEKNNKKNTVLVANLRKELSNRSLNSSHLFFKNLDVQILYEYKKSKYRTIIVNYSDYLRDLKSYFPNKIEEEKDWENEINRVDDKGLKNIIQDNLNLKKSFKIESNELKSFFYSSGKIMKKKSNVKLKKRIIEIENKLEETEKGGYSKNFIHPHYFFPPNYNRKSLLGQLRHWNTSVYTFVRGDKRMNVHLDLYARKLIQSFFSVQSILTWSRTRPEVESGVILRKWFNRKNNVMFFYAYTLFNFPLKIKRRVSKLFKEPRRLKEKDYHKFLLLQPVASLFGFDLELSRETKIQNRRWMLSKPLFKHTSFNVIIDLFIFNNKSNEDYMLENLLSRRIVYKYMYSMYANFADKIKATYSRPRFFYINILEPGIYVYYYKVVRNYEKTIIFKNGIFKFYLYYHFIQLRFSSWKENLFAKYKIPSIKIYNFLNKKKDNIPIFGNKELEVKDSSIDINVDSKKINTDLALMKIEDIEKSLSLKNEVIKDRTSVEVGEYNVLVKKERERVVYVFDLEGKWIHTDGDKDMRSAAIAAIGSWWETEKAKKAWREKKRRQSGLGIKDYHYWMGKEDEIPRTLEEISEENKKYLEEDGVVNKKKKNKKRRKQDEYLIWLQKKNSLGEKQKQQKIEEKVEEKEQIVEDPIKNKKLTINLELLENESVSFEQIEDEFLRLHPEERKKGVAGGYVIRPESFVESEEDTTDKKIKSLDGIEEDPAERWNASLFNISMVNILQQEDRSKKSGINIPLSGTDTIFTDYYKFPLVNCKSLEKELSNTSMTLEKEISSLNEDKVLSEVNIHNKERTPIVGFDFTSFVQSEVQGFNKDRKEIDYHIMKSHVNQNDTLKNLWEKKDSKFFKILDFFLRNRSRFESKEGDSISNKVFYSLYDNTKLFRGYGNFWYWFYFSAYVKREFFLVNRDILVTKTFTILPRTENSLNRKFFPGLNAPCDYDIENIDGKVLGRFWPSYNIDKEDNKINTSLFYHSEIFKPYYRYMIPLFILKSFTDLCLRLKEYSLGYVVNLFLWDNKEIENNAVVLTRFILVKILLDLLKYNYRSLIRLKPKYYFVNRVRAAKQYYTRATLSHWISINRTLAAGILSPNQFWHRFDKLLNFYYSRVVRDAAADSRRKIFVPFVLYFEDLLYINYGKWVLIRLWPLKRFFLSSYILANRVLTLLLWQRDYRKKSMGFTARALQLIRFVKLNEMKSYYGHYIEENNSWPNFIVNKFNDEAKSKNRSLLLPGLEKFYIGWGMLDRLSTYGRVRKDLHHFFATRYYDYGEVVYNTLIYNNKNPNWFVRNKLNVGNIDWWVPDYQELSFYWLRPFNYYLMKLKTQFDISGIQFQFAGKTRHARSNDRSTYKYLYSGEFFGPRHPFKLLQKKIPLNVHFIRGHTKSYIDYARSESTTEGGAVSLKVWLFARYSADVQELMLHLLEIKYLYTYLMNKSYKVDPRLTDITTFSNNLDLFDMTRQLVQKRMTRTFTFKGNIYEVVISRLVFEEIKTSSDWRKEKINSR